MNPDATQARRLAKLTFPPHLFTTSLTAVSPEVEALAVKNIKSGKELNYLQLLKHPDFTE